MEHNYLQQLRVRLGCEWHQIARAADEADKKRQTLPGIMTEEIGKPVSTDADIIVFGSLARNEWTSQSDIDWTLLIDGQAQPAHRKMAQSIQKQLRKNSLLGPGTTGTFANLTFSHDLVHLIGGEADTNITTTKRILLLLESARIDIEPSGNYSSSSAYERVLRSVLDRYLEDDTNFLGQKREGFKVPRFLLNDIIRFWRTMCVDFAWKGWKQAQKNWALRNIKLRMSRKLIFVSGLLMCASGYLDDSMQLKHNKKQHDQLIEPLRLRLLERVKMTPLQIVSHALLNYAKDETAVKLLNSYDWFLGVLNDETKRKHLGGLNAQKAYNDSFYMECRNQSHQFQEALTSLFFEDHKQLRQFTITYGVF